MALETIAQADLYSTNDVFRGIVEEIIEDSPIFNFMPFVPILGNSLQYLRESTLPGGEFYNPGDTWTEGTPVVTQHTAALKILGRDADVDKFLQLTRSKFTDLHAEVLAFTAKSVARTFQDYLIYGEDGTEPKAFDGLHALMPAGQKVAAGSGTAGGAGTFEKLDTAIDLCKPKPTVLMMGRRALRGIRKLARSQGWDLALSAAGSINRPVMHYSDIPIVINDFLTITEDVGSGVYSAKTGDDTESIFAVRFAEDGFHGISAGVPFQAEKVADSLETKDASRDRIKAYVSVVLKSTKSIAMLSGIDDQAWTN